MELVSVIVPAYNHESYVEECLDSIAAQDYPNFEIIIVDDFSSDGTSKIISAWTSHNVIINVTVIKGRKNLGISKRLDQLISFANGKFIAICASDDVLTSDSISSRMRRLKSTGVSACIGDAFIIDENSKVQHHRGMKKLHHASYSRLDNDVNDEIICNWCVLGPTLLIRKDFLISIGKYDQKLLIEDRDMYLRIAARRELTFLDKEIAGYRVLSKSLSRGSVQKKHFIYSQVALSNIKNANLFFGLNWAFLSSHCVDDFLLKNININISVRLVYFYKAIRRAVFTLIKISMKY